MARVDSSDGVSADSGRSKEAVAAAVAALGLVSTWGAGSAYANNSSATIVLNGTVTVGLSNSVSFFTPNASMTVDPPLQSGAAAWGGIFAGPVGPIGVSPPSGNQGIPISGYSFAGAIENPDGTSDLVLGFAGDGSVAIDVVWTSIFVDNLPDEERVFEPQVLAQLASPPVFDADGFVERGSQLDRMDAYYRDILTADFGESLTLIAFNGPGNTGTVVGSITVVPAPASAILMGLGLGAVARRRRV